MDQTKHMRVLQPHAHILAFYDGRVHGQRFSPDENWVDDGALELGIASYAIVHGNEALVYDTHISIPHAAFIRKHLEDAGYSQITVLLSHWHLDHVAGTEVFQDCKIIANTKTAAHLRERKLKIEAGTESGLPAINPLIMPNELFADQRSVSIGKLNLELIVLNIHSDDATVIWLPEEGILLAGDTVEDTVTYVVEPQDLSDHLRDLQRLKMLTPRKILPNHGDANRIAAGGYDASLIDATIDYVSFLQAAKTDPELQKEALSGVIANHLDENALTYFSPYERVHANNMAAVLAAHSV